MVNRYKRIGFLFSVALAFVVIGMVGLSRADGPITVGAVSVTNTPAFSPAPGATFTTSVGSFLGLSGSPGFYFHNNPAGTPLSIKASPGRIYAFSLSNTSGAVVYMQLFDAGTGSVTPGTTTPNYVVPMGNPSNQSTNFNDYGMVFSTAISYIVTTSPTGSTGAASGVVVSALYQ